uniref:Uncharacterized protein n=1 Tax=Romanomermis culicivorax TaxID=13658 RepID=A0A915K9R7_ROMCU
MSFIGRLTKNVEISDQLDDCEHDPTNMNDYIHKDVIIIGNGPSALSLSAFLSGYYPYYDPSIPHPNAVLHEKLLAARDKSIIDQ